jgi:hypothetical protein
MGQRERPTGTLGTSWLQTTGSWSVFKQVGCTAVYPYRGTPGEGLRSSYGVLSGRGDGGATVLAAGEHALGLALHLPDALAGDT